MVDFSGVIKPKIFTSSKAVLTYNVLRYGGRNKSWAPSWSFRQDGMDDALDDLKRSVRDLISGKGQLLTWVCHVTYQLLLQWYRSIEPDACLSQRKAICQL